MSECMNEWTIGGYLTTLRSFALNEWTIVVRAMTKRPFALNEWMNEWMNEWINWLTRIFCTEWTSEVCLTTFCTEPTKCPRDGPAGSWLRWTFWASSLGLGAQRLHIVHYYVVLSYYFYIKLIFARNSKKFELRRVTFLLPTECFPSRVSSSCIVLVHSHDEWLSVSSWCIVVHEWQGVPFSCIILLVHRLYAPSSCMVMLRRSWVTMCTILVHEWQRFCYLLNVFSLVRRPHATSFISDKVHLPRPRAPSLYIIVHEWQRAPSLCIIVHEWQRAPSSCTVLVHRRRASSSCIVVHECQMCKKCE